MSDANSGNSDTGVGTAPARTTAEQTELSLPPVVPPATKSPVQFNQQVNVYQQIPQSAWDRLSAAQIVELSKEILTQMEATDKRHFEYAMADAKRSASGRKLSIICGSIIAIAGFGAAGWLAIHGHDTVAFVIALPLTTVLAIVVGNRFLDH